MAGIQVEQLDLPSLARYFATKKAMSDGNTDLNNRIDEEVEDLNRTITNQVNNLKNKDTELNNKIDTEVSSRKNADTTLDNRITSEVRNLNTTINSKENSLNNKITAETTSREARDSELNQAITAEATAREAKDSELNQAIIKNVSNLNDTIQKLNVLSNGICYSTVITGDDSKTSFTVTHNLSTNKAQVTVLDKDNYIVYPTVKVGTNDVTISFFSAPASGTSYTVVITASDK